MSLLTSFLKLFKYDPVNDKESTFNITKALNENWDKIDTKVEELSNSVVNAESVEGSQEKATAALTAAKEYTDQVAESKVDKVLGKGLSTEDYTTEEKIKLGGISKQATKTESSVINGQIKIDGMNVKVYEHPGGTNPHGTTKNDIGLSNVDNIKQMPITGGTFTGIAVAQNNTSYTTAQLRNIILSTADASGTAPNGAIWIKYKP